VRRRGDRELAFGANIPDYEAMIVKDCKRVERVAIERLKAELRAAFAAPDATYVALTANDVFLRRQARNCD